MSDGNSFWYAEGAPETTVIWKVDPVANTKVLLFETERLRSTLRNELGRDPPYEGAPFSSFSFIDTEELTVRFSVDRSIDLSVCPYFPVGTHFLWHILNGGVVYLVMHVLILNQPEAKSGLG